ncbi:MAG: hypothetical protein ACJAZE_000915 [Halioglobus sp.]|jgi:hypothetical protein
MSAPPLPELFGNYALHDFFEVIPTDSVSWLPQTGGWHWLAALLLLLSLRCAWRSLRLWYRNRYRREAIKRLREVSSNYDSAEFLTDFNRVLKITALVAYSREQVARLSGEQWVKFLNRKCHNPPFDHELSLLLATTTYRQQSMQKSLQKQLLEAGLVWVKEHQEQEFA